MAGMAASCALIILSSVGCEHEELPSRLGGGGSNSSNSGGKVSSAGVDEVPFESLSWTFGMGFSGAVLDEVVIANVDFGPDQLRYSYVVDLSVWGYAPGDAKGRICMFVKNNSGSWVGGMTDWISTDRTFRDYHNVASGWHGWSLSDVPNPCEAALVILDNGGGRRSNVITGTWTRGSLNYN